MSETQKEIEARREFLQIRQHYIDTAHRSSKVFDNTMITLSTWALWASMFFLNRDVVLWYTWILVLWRIFLWGTILLTVISFYISEQANWLSVEKHDRSYCWKDIKHSSKLSCMIECKNNTLNVLKRISIITLIVWIILIAWFLYLNL